MKKITDFINESRLSPSDFKKYQKDFREQLESYRGMVKELREESKFKDFDERLDRLDELIEKVSKDTLSLQVLDRKLLKVLEERTTNLFQSLSGFIASEQDEEEVEEAFAELEEFLSDVEGGTFDPKRWR